jgi:dTDP-4-amino-4,6-dideoxygalactose transaminase
LSAVLEPPITGSRFEIVNRLNKRGVGTSIYYPKPVPHMSYYRNRYGYDEKSFPSAAWISYNSIALPVGPHLEESDMSYIAETLIEAIEGL